MSLHEEMVEMGRRARAAGRQLAGLEAGIKNRILTAMADAIEADTPAILEANAEDLREAANGGLSAAMLERLKLDERRVASMAQGMREVAALPDPVGRILDERTRPNGLRLEKVSTPIGVVVIIFESRPNVTADAASLCFKSGNACILRGGREAIRSNRAIEGSMRRAARGTHPAFPEDAIQVVGTTDREAIRELLSLVEYVDLCMPRGGEGLIRAVAECSRVPVIKHYKGVCHVYVDGEADLSMAESVVMNAKVQRPSACNAMETLLVDRRVAGIFLPRIAAALGARGVEIRTDGEAMVLLRAMGDEAGLKLREAVAADWSTEYTDYILNLRVVDGVGEAIGHINRHGSAHSDSIVTANEATARQFLERVDSAAVYWNASTRFTDGYEFGMGAEIGISTDKVGARGPMGLEELTSYKWKGYGSGQIRS